MPPAAKRPAKPRAKAKPKPSEEPMVEVRNPNVPSYRGRVNKAKYDAMKPLVLKAVPKKAPGVTQAEMFEAIGKLAPREIFPAETFYWWGKSVQLDLEARGVIARDPKAKPLRWRRLK